MELKPRKKSSTPVGQMVVARISASRGPGIQREIGGGGAGQDLDLHWAGGCGATDEMDRDEAGDGGGDRTFPERWEVMSKKAGKGGLADFRGHIALG